jgi:hypothetical protein
MIGMVKFGASLRRAEGEEGHPLVLLLPIFLLSVRPVLPAGTESLKKTAIHDKMFRKARDIRAFHADERR